MSPRIVVLTGAGISAESGLPTFRDKDGLWEGHRPEDVATPEAFTADPEMVHRFYDTRRRALLSVEPNAAHRALARLEEVLDDDLLLITQNIDDLHERGGSRRVLHMHGRLRAARCTSCRVTSDWDDDLGDHPPCPACSRRGELRPDVVWFGERPYFMDEIVDGVGGCEVFVAIGTSGLVYPAAGMVDLAADLGAHTIEINPVATGRFAEDRIGPATEQVPRWVDEALA